MAQLQLQAMAAAYQQQSQLASSAAAVAQLVQQQQQQLTRFSTGGPSASLGLPVDQSTSGQLMTHLTMPTRNTEGPASGLHTVASLVGGGGLPLPVRVASGGAVGQLQPSAHSQLLQQQQLTTCSAPSATTSSYPGAQLAHPAQNHQQLQEQRSSLATVAGLPTPIGGQLQVLRHQPTSVLGLATPTPLDHHAHRLAAASTNSGGWCLFVYNLAPEIEESVIWKLFGPFGAVQQVNLVKDLQTDKCKGFAFVTMSDYTQALLAIQGLNGQLLANRVLQVSFKTSKVRKTMQTNPKSTEGTNNESSGSDSNNFETQTAIGGSGSARATLARAKCDPKATSD